MCAGSSTTSFTSSAATCLYARADTRLSETTHGIGSSASQSESTLKNSKRSSAESGSIRHDEDAAAVGRRSNRRSSGTTENGLPARAVLAPRGVRLPSIQGLCGHTQPDNRLATAAHERRSVHERSNSILLSVAARPPLHPEDLVSRDTTVIGFGDVVFSDGALNRFIAALRAQLAYLAGSCAADARHAPRGRSLLTFLRFMRRR